MGASASASSIDLLSSAILLPFLDQVFASKSSESLLLELRKREISNDVINAIDAKFTKLQSVSAGAKTLANFILLILEGTDPEKADKGQESDLQSDGDNSKILTGGPYGVSLQFLVHFMDKYNIPEDMSTGDVVRNIIIPETAKSQLTYVEDKLNNRLPDYFIDLNETSTTPPKGMICPEIVFSRFFLSHPWSMPFVKLIAGVRKTIYSRFQQNIMYFGCCDNHIEVDELYGQNVYFWIDVFCKNQHKPSPAMEEFHLAMSTPGEVIVALWPSDRPISLTRIWCCFEIWTAIQLKANMILSDVDDGLHQAVVSAILKEVDEKDFIGENRMAKLGTDAIISYLTKVINVDVQNAEATMPADIELILGMINSSIGVDTMNQQILRGIADSIVQKDYLSLYDPFPSCFDGDGLVSMADGGLKKVHDVVVGDVVLSHAGRLGRVTLVTRTATNAPYLCQVQGVYLTPEHPVFVKDTWVRPWSVASKERMENIKEVYNFELDNDDGVVINGLHVATLSQDVDLPLEFQNKESAGYGSGWASNPKRLQYIASSITFAPSE